MSLHVHDSKSIQKCTVNLITYMWVSTRILFSARVFSKVLEHFVITHWTVKWWFSIQCKQVLHFTAEARSLCSDVLGPFVSGSVQYSYRLERVEILQFSFHIRTDVQRKARILMQGFNSYPFFFQITLKILVIKHPSLSGCSNSTIPYKI